MLFIRKMIVSSAIALFAGVACANVVTGSLPIATVVTANCTVSSANLNFGNYDPIGSNVSSPKDGVTTFQVSCTKGANVVISMNEGMFKSEAQGTTRAMSSNSGDFLSYELYTEAGHSNVWNNQNPITYTSTSSTARTQTVYGRIPAHQNVSAGTYTDTVTITAEF